MSPAEEAFEAALDGAEEAKGEREKVTFRSQELDALVHEFEQDPDFAPGGYTQAQPVRVQLRKSEVTQPIEKNEAITVQGRDLQVMQHTFLPGYVHIVAGDITTDTQDF